jgi:hypothetical protein
MEDGPHSHENIFSDGHPVKDGSMTDMAIPPKPCSAVRKRMDDAIFLDIGPVPYLDISEIPPQNGPGADIAVLPDGDPSDENRRGMHERGFAHGGPFPFKFIHGHKVMILS